MPRSWNGRTSAGGDRVPIDERQFFRAPAPAKAGTKSSKLILPRICGHSEFPGILSCAFVRARYVPSSSFVIPLLSSPLLLFSQSRPLRSRCPLRPHMSQIPMSATENVPRVTCLRARTLKQLAILFHVNFRTAESCSAINGHFPPLSLISEVESAPKPECGVIIWASTKMYCAQRWTGHFLIRLQRNDNGIPETTPGPYQPPFAPPQKNTHNRTSSPATCRSRLARPIPTRPRRSPR